MDTNRRDTPEPLAAEPADFSLVLGGPLYQLLRRARLSDDALTLVHRRIVVGVLVMWLPLRYVPFSKETVVQLGVITLAPLLPLLLTMISLEELVKRLLSAVF